MHFFNISEVLSGFMRKDFARTFYCTTERDRKELETIERNTSAQTRTAPINENLMEGDCTRLLARPINTVPTIGNERVGASTVELVGFHI
jgi:hypothetical protein